MPKAKVTSVVLSVRMEVPKGSNVAEVLQYTRDALAGWAGGGDPALPINDLNREKIVVNLVKKETIYG